MAQTVERLPTMRETWVQSLGQEDLLEKEMATHSTILAWKIPWTEEPGRLHLWGRKESDTTERLHFLPHHSIMLIFYTQILIDSLLSDAYTFTYKTHLFIFFFLYAVMA